MGGGGEEGWGLSLKNIKLVSVWYNFMVVLRRVCT